MSFCFNHSSVWCSLRAAIYYGVPDAGKADGVQLLLSCAAAKEDEDCRA